MRTTVWFVVDSSDSKDSKFLYFHTARNFGKAKRLKYNPHCLIAPCSMFGRLKKGGWIECESHLVTSPEEENTARNLLRKKYGIRMRIVEICLKLMRKTQIIFKAELKDGNL